MTPIWQAADTVILLIRFSILNRFGIINFKMMRRSYSAPITAALLLTYFRCAAAAPPPKLDRYEYTEYHMGVDVRMVVYAESREKAVNACAAAYKEFAQLDTIMSDYRVDSELTQLCAKAGSGPVEVSRELYRVLERCQLLAQQTDGGFDVTCGPIVRLWRQARKTHVLPTREEVDQARMVVGWRYMQLDPEAQTVDLAKPGMQLDLGAIGKGYADDLAQQVLKRHGVNRALIQAGGDIVVSGPPPGQSGWSLKTEIKADDLPGASPEHPDLMRVANCAVSTSGDTEQFVDIGGKRYSHIVDPRTGEALTSRLAVLIVARDGLTSDGLSTAVSVVGAAKGKDLVSRYRGARVWIGHD